MNIKEQIKNYIQNIPEPKQEEILSLHKNILQWLPHVKLWFLDGKNSEQKTVSNPNIGYGSYNIQYADGSKKEFYQIGLSANSTGISVYIMGMLDKNYLPKTYSAKIGKASITGYCIKFKKIADINMDILKAIIKERTKIQ